MADMKILTADTFSEMIRVTNDWADKRGLYCHRGQSSSKWGLVPTVFRPIYEKYKHIENPTITQEEIKTSNETELQIYSEVRERSRGYRHEKVNPNNPWEMLCLAQHFGVPTRLLDWTSNILVAAFFAVEDLNEDEDGAIWSFNVSKFLGGDSGNSVNEFMIDSLDMLPNQGVTFFHNWWLENLPRDIPTRTINSFRLLRPPDIDDRIKIQSGYFTLYISQIKNGDEFVWDHFQYMKHKNPETLRKLIIPGRCKHDFLVALRRMGINHHTLFPGLSGLGRHLKIIQKELIYGSSR